jgi:RNA polymerase sigma-70 factor (ECF subfamily)
MACPTICQPADDREAQFDALYEAHRQTLHAYFLGRIGDPELALDLLQEAFVRAWRNLDLLLGLAEARQRAWLFAIGRNLVIDQYRGRAARTTMHDTLMTTAQIEEPASESAERTVEREGELRLVEAAIERLPEDLRTVLVLQVLGERTSAEIGELLGRPAGTVRYQLSRARKRLAEEMARLEVIPLTPRPPLPCEGEGEPERDRRHEHV